MHHDALWIVSYTGNPRFPFRIEIRRNNQREIALWAQDKWPGSGKQIFCIREGEPTGEPVDFPEVERVGISRLERYGKQLTVILDRQKQKRCSFLFLEKEYARKPGTYEQIFFRTQRGMEQHRSRSRVRLHRAGEYQIIIDSGERYPWKFGDIPVERRRLPAGDYAVQCSGELLAYVERKTFDNMLSDIGSIQVLHEKLADLARYPRAVFVVEAEYRDFLNSKKLAGRWPASHAARVLAELHALHPELQIVYAGSRKAAEQWAAAYFAAVAADYAQQEQDEAELRERPQEFGFGSVRNDRDSSEEIRRLILADGELPRPFSIQDLRQRLPNTSDGTIRTVLNALKGEGRIKRSGAGPGSRWHLSRR